MSRHSQVYKDFYELHRDSFQAIVSYYESNQFSIRRLPFEEQLELLAEYLNACFETAGYQKYLDHVDELIENLLIDRIEIDRADDIFHEALFRKSACLFNLERYEASLDISRQLCRLDPTNRNARVLYRRNLYQNLPAMMKHIRYMAAFGLLLAAVMTAVTLFGYMAISKPVIETIALIRNLIFSTSLLILFVIEMKIQWTVYRVLN